MNNYLRAVRASCRTGAEQVVTLRWVAVLHPRQAPCHASTTK